MKAIDWATWRAVLSKLKWLAFCIIRGPVFIRSASGKRDSSETDRPKSPSGQKRSPRQSLFEIKGRPYATLKTPIFAHCFGWT
jgi:hypothetical protein